MEKDPIRVRGPKGISIQVLVRSGRTFESLFSDSYLSDAGHRIGQQLVWPHRFYCDGGGGESSLASNSKRSPLCIVHQSPRSRATSTNFFPRRVTDRELVREAGLVGFPGFQRKRMKRRFWGGVKKV